LNLTEFVNKMPSNNLIEFTSEECKHNGHSNCASQWVGLGFIVLCTCTCHEEKGDARSVANRISSVTNWLSHDDRGTPLHDL
jgi:hypothetical protein